MHGEQHKCSPLLMYKDSNVVSSNSSQQHQPRKPFLDSIFCSFIEIASQCGVCLVSGHERILIYIVLSWCIAIWLFNIDWEFPNVLWLWWPCNSSSWRKENNVIQFCDAWEERTAASYELDLNQQPQIGFTKAKLETQYRFIRNGSAHYYDHDWIETMQRL